MNAHEELEGSLQTSHYRSVARMTWAKIRHQYEERLQDLRAAGKSPGDARKAALDPGALRSFMSEMLTRGSLGAVREFLRTRSDWGTGAALIEKDWSVVSLIDQSYPVATWTALDSLDASSAADDARWTAWVQAWRDEFRREDRPSEAASARVFGHPPPVDEDGKRARRGDMFDGVVLKPEFTPRVKSVLDWGAFILEFFVNLVDEEEDEEDDRRARRTRRRKKPRTEQPHRLDEVLKDGGVEMPKFVDIVGQFLGGTEEARETAEMIASSRDPNKLLRVFVERFANARAEREEDEEDEETPPPKASPPPPPHRAASATSAQTRTTPPCSPPAPPGGSPQWTENLDAHLRARGLGHIADTARVTAAPPGTTKATAPDPNLDKTFETLADKAAARAVQAIRPLIEQYSAKVEKSLKEQSEQIRGLVTEVREQETRLREIEAEFRVVHAELEQAKLAAAETKASALTMIEPHAVVITEPVAVDLETTPVAAEHTVEPIAEEGSTPTASGGDAPGDALHAAAAIEELTGATGIRGAIDEVQQGIHDLKANVASNNQLIQEMEAKLAEARRQREALTP